MLFTQRVYTENVNVRGKIRHIWRKAFPQVINATMHLRYLVIITYGKAECKRKDGECAAEVLYVRATFRILWSEADEHAIREDCPAADNPLFLPCRASVPLEELLSYEENVSAAQAKAEEHPWIP